MSLLESASLIITPNAYKNGKLYALKPTDGSGDLVWSRAGGKTRVNPAILVENLPYNLLSHSNDFLNSVWIKSVDVTVIPNNTLSPTGKNNASEFVLGAAAVGAGMYQGGTFYNATRNKSIWVKASVAGGTIGLTNPYYASSELIHTLTTEWARIEVPQTSTGTFDGLFLRKKADTPSSIFIYGAQLTEGATLKPYLRTTDRLNIPSIDYTGGGCPSILVEPQGTNLLSFSQSLDDVSWTKTGVLINSSNILSPSGTEDVKLMILTNSFGVHALSKTTVAPTLTNTVSVFVKYKDRQFVQLVFSGSYSFHYANFDLINGIITNGSYDKASITPASNGFYRITITSTGASTGIQPFLWSIDSANSSRAGNVNGSGSDGYYVWGFQLETGSIPSSYIPTTTGTVTRVADAVLKSGISSLIGQTEGTIICGFNYFKPSTDAYIFDFFDSTLPLNQESISVSLNSGNNIVGLIYNGGAIQSAFSFGQPSLGYHEVKITYKLNDIKYYLDGILVSTDNTATIPTMNAYAIGMRSNNSLQYGGGIKFLAHVPFIY